MMSFDDWRDKALLGLLGLIMPGIIYVVVTSLNSASQDFVEKQIARAMLTSPYMNDKGAIQQSIQDLYRISSKTQADLEKNRETAAMAAQYNYEQLSQLRVEIERIKIRQELYEEEHQIKKKRIRGGHEPEWDQPPYPF